MAALINTSYRFSEVVHRLGRGFVLPSRPTAGEQLRCGTGFCYFEPGRRTNLTPLRLTNLKQLSTAAGLKVTAMHTQMPTSKSRTIRSAAC